MSIDDRQRTTAQMNLPFYQGEASALYSNATAPYPPYPKGTNAYNKWVEGWEAGRPLRSKFTGVVTRDTIAEREARLDLEELAEYED